MLLLHPAYNVELDCKVDVFTVNMSDNVREQNQRLHEWELLQSVDKAAS